MIGAQSAFLRDDDDFGAIQITDPHGVVALNGRTGEIRLFSWREWLRERGGIKAHYRDLASGRTVNVDHLEFCHSSELHGFFHDELGRTAIRVPLDAAFLAENRTALSKVFCREQLGRISEAADHSNSWEVPSSYTTALVQANATTS